MRRPFKQWHDSSGAIADCPHRTTHCVVYKTVVKLNAEHSFSFDFGVCTLHDASPLNEGASPDHIVHEMRKIV